MRILSIDPGYERVGVAVIEKDGSGDELLYSNCFKTRADKNFPERLKKIGDEISRLIKKFNPSVLAVETLLFHNNQKTAMGVSEAKGVIVYCAVRENLKVYEFTPLQIKNALTGEGKSSKGQVKRMVENLINIEKEIIYDDEFDAIAVGITCSAVLSNNYPQ